ncbi:aminopeptidase P N-terminal domain-containing protein [Flavobacteriaceae bacterium F89]|uniref:Xaa-Pro aminopeptidase n=1 Tax=Cerina litoralis TaxID=2874477 RepID=A0AAE3ET10_9FLAO|nr:Xaa-Pro aminopeptidase [Cerina litoralis]MCG2460448.1 aminopeptidase P N-terminal domain-containing protein [Cerina litoralis]
MRYNNIKCDLFIGNRNNFSRRLHENTIAILTGNDAQHTNADDVPNYVQNSDLFYLTGITQENTILLLYPDAFKVENKEILFINRSDEETIVYDGKGISKETAIGISGVGRVEFIENFEKILQSMAFEANGFYLGHNEHVKRATKDKETKQDRFIKWCKKKYPLHQYYRVATITRDLRQIKSDEEITLIKKAIEISLTSFKNALRACKPSVKEYVLEAELTYNLTRSGAERHAFRPIVASGKNACILHYIENDQACKNGEMVLMDFGVCYAHYNSDTTRCFPVNGKFSQRQKEVYSAVLNCLKEGSKILKPGVLLPEYEIKMANLIERELIKLGLLNEGEVANQDKDNPLYKEYFMHGTAHHIGLDVHDVGLYSRALEPGMVVTCEPGIYIREENLGCRLENMYLITENGAENLTKEMPIEMADIEELLLG